VGVHPLVPANLDFRDGYFQIGEDSMINERENDPDFCSECECIVRDGGEHSKEKHLALPKGTMAYDQIVFAQADSK